MSTLTHRDAWRPVQGPASGVPGTVAGTGHTLGIVYACHYWGGTYLPVLAHAEGSVTVEWVSGRDRGTVRTHRTQLNPYGRRNYAHDDHPVTERCLRSYECAQRALRADRRPMSG